MTAALQSNHPLFVTVDNNKPLSYEKALSAQFMELKFILLKDIEPIPMKSI